MWRDVCEGYVKNSEVGHCDGGVLECDVCDARVIVEQKSLQVAGGTGFDGHRREPSAAQDLTGGAGTAAERRDTEISDIAEAVPVDYNTPERTMVETKNIAQ